MFGKVVVANRGAVAVRILRTLKSLGIRTVAVYSEADKASPHLAFADETYAIGPAEPKASYLNQEILLDVIRLSKADGLHPGYGFLSENHRFASRVGAGGATFIGPSPRWLEMMGEKTRAREIMARHGLPMCPSSPILSDIAEEMIEAAQSIGFPVLVKPANGGGGIGMLAANNPEELLVAAERARSLANRSFDDAKIYLEQLLLEPRHIEFQVLADKSGAVRHVFERDCSVQRRHQKVIEEAPAPALPRQIVEAMAMQIQGVLGEIGYDNIGTVETLHSANAGFNFLEMNTRLQVEHAVTEEITGIDLVAAQVRLAAGHAIGDVLPAQIVIKGHAIEARVYAEDPKRFFPSPGTLKIYRPPSDGSVRVETGYVEGNVVTPHYDPMLAKVIAHGSTRNEAITRLQSALDSFEVQGVKTNIPFITRVLTDEEFRSGRVHTGLTSNVLARSAK